MVRRNPNAFVGLPFETLTGAHAVNLDGFDVLPPRDGLGKLLDAEVVDDVTIVVEVDITEFNLAGVGGACISDGQHITCPLPSATWIHEIVDGSVRHKVFVVYVETARIVEYFHNANEGSVLKVVLGELKPGGFDRTLFESHGFVGKHIHILPVVSSNFVQIRC